MAAPGPATHLTYATAPSFAADPMWGVVNRFADEGGDETMADAGQGNAAGQGSSSASAAVPAQSAQMVQEPEGEVDGESDSDSESGGSSGSDWGNRKKSGRKSGSKKRRKKSVGPGKRTSLPLAPPMAIPAPAAAATASSYIPASLNTTSLPTPLVPPSAPAPRAIPPPLPATLYRKKPSSLDPCLSRQTQIDQHFRPSSVDGFPVFPVSLQEAKSHTPAVSSSQATLIDAPISTSRPTVPKLLIPEATNRTAVVHQQQMQQQQQQAKIATTGAAAAATTAITTGPSSPTKAAANSASSTGSSSTPTLPVNLPNFLHTLKKRMPRVPLIPNNDPLQLMQIFQEAQVKDKMRELVVDAASRWASEGFDGLQNMSKPDQVLEKIWHHLAQEGRTICYFIVPDNTLLLAWLTEAARHHIPLTRWLEFRYPGSVPDPDLVTITFPLDPTVNPATTPTTTNAPMMIPQPVKVAARRASPPLTQLVTLRSSTPGALPPESPLTPPAELLKDEDLILGTVHRSSQSLARLVEAATGDDSEPGERERTAGWELFTAYSLKDLERHERERWSAQ